MSRDSYNFFTVLGCLSVDLCRRIFLDQQKGVGGRYGVYVDSFFLLRFLNLTRNVLPIPYLNTEYKGNIVYFP